MVNTIKFSQMAAGGDLAPGDMTPGLLNIMDTPSNVLFNNPWTFLAPGSTASRPVPSVAIDGRLRFNTDTLVYEYYDTITAMWVELSGNGTGTVNPGTVNSIAYYPANGSIVSPTNANNLAVLVTNDSGLPSLSTILPIGLSIPSAIITSSTAELTSGQVAATPINPTDIANKAYVDDSFSAGVNSITGTTNQVIASSSTGNITLSLPQDVAPGSSPTFSQLTLTDGLIADLTIQATGGSLVSGSSVGGFTGTLILWPTTPSTGSLTISSTPNSGNFNNTLLDTASSAARTWSLPDLSGTIAMTSQLTGGTVTAVSGTTNQIGSTGGTTPVISLASNPIVPGTGGIQIPTGTTAQRAGASGTIRFNSQLTLFESTVDGTNWATIETSASGVASISGTANQVIASSSTGNITLSLPQNINIDANVAFGTLQLRGSIISGTQDNTVIQLSDSTFAVNFAGIANSITTNPVIIRGLGTDTNVLLQLQGKGTSGVAVQGATSGTNAATGYSGEIITAFDSGVPLTNLVVANIASIVLTPGNWDVDAGCSFSLSSGSMSLIACGLSTTSATFLPNTFTALQGGLALNSTCALPVITQHYNVNTNTTIFLVAQSNFTVGAVGVTGNITAKRR